MALVRGAANLTVKFPEENAGVNDVSILIREHAWLMTSDMAVYIIGVIVFYFGYTIFKAYQAGWIC